MKSYRVKVRDEKAAFFEELMRYLDFCDYENVEGFSEPRIYPNFEIRSNEQNQKNASKKTSKQKKQIQSEQDNGMDSLREVMSRIDAMRDRSRKG